VLNIVAFVSDRSKPEDQREFHGPWVTPSSLEEMQKDYQGWDHLVTDLFPVSAIYYVDPGKRKVDWAVFLCLGFQLIEKPEHWALHDLLPLDNWIKGRVALLGDAVSAIH
jgi:salicylate hydroxylase